MSVLATVRPRFAAAAWPPDPAILELRWGALTIAVMAALAGAAHALAGPTSAFGPAFAISTVAAVALGAVTLAARDDAGLVGRAVRARPARLALAPLVVCVGLAAVGPPPPDNLTPPPTLPLLVLSLSYAAVGPGFGYAAGLVGAVTVLLTIAHALEPGHDLVDPDTVGLAVRSLVSILSAAGLYLVIGRLRRERRRADMLAERQQARVDELERLHRILARFDGSAPLSTVLADVVSDLGREFGLRHVSLYLAEPDGALVIAGAIDYEAPIPRFPLGSGVMGRAVRTRRTQWVRDVTTDPDYVSDDPAVTSELAVPLVHADEPLGVLNIEGTLDGPISEEHVAVAEMVGGAIASAIRLARLRETREREVDRLVALHAILRRFDGSRSIRDVIGDVARDVARRFGIPLVAFYLPAGDGRLALVGVAGYGGPIDSARLGVGVIGRAAALRRTEYVPDVSTDPDYWAIRADIRSEVAVPIVLDDELLGVVNFEGTEADPIGPGDVAIAEMVARSIAGAIRTAQLDEERRERLDSIERVLAVSRDLGADLDRERVIGSICEAARDLLHADVVAYVDRTPDGGYRLGEAIGLPPDVIGAPVEAGRGLIGRALASRQREVGLSGPDDWPAAVGPALAGGGRSQLGLAAPIEIDGSIAGVLVAARVDEGHRLSDIELRIADLLIAQATIALRNADLHARVAEAAVRDPLTGLLNRRYFDAALIHAFAAARRSGTPLSVIVLDLDRFSAVNNEHGHSVGDEVLRRVAEVLRIHVREADIAARYGGEEFVVIAPGATRDQAVEVAERIRTAVARTSRRPIDGIRVRIALSAGVATMLGDERDADELFRAADSGLLAAKRAGRDRVVAV
jgi:diguanylate cyclase (GGDEF)-like protein